MSIILRAEKGTPLTVEEMDGNFQDLDGRLKHFEAQGGDLESIAQITEDSGDLVITGSKGSELGRIQLPTPKIRFRGSWQGEIPYFVNDIISHDDSLYICKTLNEDGDFNEANWTLIFKRPQREAAVSTSLPVFDPGDLPDPLFGKLILLGGERPRLLLGTGDQWQQIIVKPLE